MDPLRVGISIGDVNGIGPEVIVKALSNQAMLDFFTPVIYATPEAFSAFTEEEHTFEFTAVAGAREASAGRINLVAPWKEPLEYTPGQATAVGGRAAAQSLERAVADLKEGSIQALVTAPINKSVMPADDFPFPGHTRCSPPV